MSMYDEYIKYFDMFPELKKITEGLSEIHASMLEIDRRTENIINQKKEKSINYAEFIVEKSDAGKLADRFTKLLEKK